MKDIPRIDTEPGEKQHPGAHSEQDEPGVKLDQTPRDRWSDDTCAERSHAPSVGHAPVRRQRAGFTK